MHGFRQLSKAEKAKAMKEVKESFMKDQLTAEQHKVCIEILSQPIMGMKESIKELIKKLPCRQYQYILMDLESIMEHFQSLYEQGPIPPDREIPLEESQIAVDAEAPSAEEVQELPLELPSGVDESPIK